MTQLIRRICLPCACLALLLAFAGVSAHAQNGAGDGGTASSTQNGPPQSSSDDQGQSVASRFFMSWKTTASNERKIELLGTIIIWFLLLLSVVSIGLIGNMALTNQRKSIIPEAVVAEAKMMITTGKYRELMSLTENEESFFSRVLHGALKESSHGFSAMIRALEQTSDELTTIRLRRIEYLNVLGQVSPMIGLFGTVYGMILAFQAIVITGGNADPVLLAGGIGTALTTTFWGLVVAIPALAGFAIVRNRIDELTTEATLVAEDLCNQFRPKSKSATPVAAKGGAGRGEHRAPAASPKVAPKPSPNS